MFSASSAVSGSSFLLVSGSRKPSAPLTRVKLLNTAVGMAQWYTAKIFSSGASNPPVRPDIAPKAEAVCLRGEVVGQWVRLERCHTADLSAVTHFRLKTDCQHLPNRCWKQFLHEDAAYRSSPYQEKTPCDSERGHSDGISWKNIYFFIF